MQNEKVTDFKTVYQVTELKKKLLKGPKTVPGAGGVCGDLVIDRYAAHIVPLLSGISLNKPKESKRKGTVGPGDGGDH